MNAHLGADRPVSNPFTLLVRLIPSALIYGFLGQLFVVWFLVGAFFAVFPGIFIALLVAQVSGQDSLILGAAFAPWSVAMVSVYFLWIFLRAFAKRDWGWELMAVLPLSCAALLSLMLQTSFGVLIFDNWPSISHNDPLGEQILITAKFWGEELISAVLLGFPLHQAWNLSPLEPANDYVRVAFWGVQVSLVATALSGTRKIASGVFQR